MTTYRTIFVAALATIIWGCVFGLQRPPPRYSQQYMPQTSFTCRNKIVGSYYADPETDCQLFHVCVSVAGSIQDYRFLCPNDTAFDQESQTCADWYDVDCEAATLYYASDNFDLYRLGSGLESLHYDSIRSDLEPQDHLQRSESNDPIRSPLNAYNSNSYKEPEAQKKNNQFAARNQKQISPEFEKEKEKEKLPEPEKKNLRKVHRKPVGQGFTNAYTTSRPSQPSSAAPPVQPTQAPRFVYSTASPRPSSPAVSYTSKANLPPSTLRPTTKYAATTFRSTANSQDAYSANYQTTTVRSAANISFHNNFSGFNRFETTAKPASTTHPEPQTYSGQYTQVPSSTTKQPAGNYQQYNPPNNNNNNYNYNNNFNYNNGQRTNNTTAYPTTTLPSTNYDNNNYNNYNNNNNNNNNNYNNNYNNNNNNYNNNNNNYNNNNNNYNNNNNNYNNNNNNYNANFESRPTSKKADYNQNTYTANTYAPTTYSPVTKKFNNNNRQYFDKSTTLTTKSAQYTETDSTKAAKKVTQYKNYQNYETTTRSYDFGRSSVGLGFSPSSVNHLAENVRPTTPAPRRAAAPTTYNPNSFNVNTHATQSQAPQQKSSYYQNQPTKQHSTTPRYFEESTTRKAAKKNDYDYAYYDNGPLEYDNLELEHVTSNKESVKIT